MPAKDKYHDIVIRALEKDGWVLEDEQYLLVVEERTLWVDLLVSKENEQRAILVEVKSLTSASQVEDLANAIGKYLLYSAILEVNNSNLELYLAVPIKAFEGIFNERLGEIIVQKIQMPMIVFNPDTEGIHQWIK